MAARPGGALAFPSSPTSLLLSRSRSAPDLAAAPTRTGRRRRWLVAGVPAVAGALAASAPASAAVLRDGGATLLVTAGAYSLVRAFDALTERRLIEQVSELLRGPLYYVIVLLIIVLVFWRDSPIGIVSLSMMSGGDGFADIVGRRFGLLKLPFNKKKSWAGSVAMFISGSLLSALMLLYFSWLGHIQVSWDQALGKLLLVALAATVVECIPVNDVVDDNISVPLATMFVAFLLFGNTAT
ncbi:hypothetical protein QYE76_047264 [Lolium multiflorum]|uniref:phytol kinase n=1 Tax=Lolium multiflorum TaxID=4521 RepID=A0AAD8X1F9_LOLMU|nr:hypothetical protein QYE76_047264 [Lolium multiflorum]